MKGLVVAATFLTRVPLPVRVDWPRDLARSIPWFPVVGGLIGGIVGIGRWWLGAVLPDSAAAIIAVAIGVLVTGAFHEDGLADSFDGLGGGSSPQQALELMKDSRIGTYGATALMLALILKISLLASITGVTVVAAAVAAGALSRAVAVVAMSSLPASSQGLGADYVAAVKPIRVVFALVVGLGIGALLGWVVIPAALLALLVGAGVVAWAKRKIGGVTGDVLGAVQVVAELAILAVALGWPSLLPW